MQRPAVFLIFVSLISTASAKAVLQTVTLRKGTVLFEMPGKKWKYYKDMLGLPLVLVGPSKSSQRVTISVTATGIDNLKLDPTKLEVEQNAWFSGRKQFVDKFSGRVTKKYNYKEIKTRNLAMVHRIGYQYQVEDKTFESYSYYFNCKNQLYHVKSLGEVKIFPNMAKTSDKFLDSLNCQ